MFAFSFLIFFLDFLALVGATMLLMYGLDRPACAALRKALVESRHKWLACATPFSPAITLALMRLVPGAFVGAIPLGSIMLATFVSSIGTAVFAACWLCLPKDPQDPARRTQRHYAALLAVVFWLLDIAVLRFGF